MVTLVVMYGGSAGREHPLGEGLNRVGRAAGNEVMLEDASISASHCELWVMRERLLVRDLASTNGTFINGRPVSEAEVNEGDVLALGSVEMRVVGVPKSVVTVSIPKPPPPPPPPPRFAPDGYPCCIQHSGIHAQYRCRRCGEQFCPDCVRLLGRRGGASHAYCPLCGAECVAIMAPGRAGGDGGASGGWLAKLTKTLRLRR
ncbi:MAG: FHA domain-containing protein [Verrucomicrobiae bacterium]|nr:FHA domain-containing protein [Verrucomicrobiae bacterium]